MAAFRELDPAGVIDLRTSGPATVLVDVRTDPELARTGVIEGAVHIPLQTLPQRMGELDQAQPLVIYCQSGARSAQACAFLAARGFDEVFNLRGGILAWAREGHPLVVAG